MNRLSMILIALFLQASSSAQRSAIPVNISFFNEATAIPFTQFITTPIHPGIQIGTEINYSIKKHTRLFQTFNTSYFFHNHLTQGIGLLTELGYEYRHRSGIALEALLGVGYMHSFATSDEYSFVNGEYVNKTDKGNARIIPSFSIDIGYYLKKTRKNSPKFFMRYQSWAEYPYSPGFIPVMTHINFHIGTKIYVNKKKI